jgi:hypothetical protein
MHDQRALAETMFLRRITVFSFSAKMLIRSGQ